MSKYFKWSVWILDAILAYCIIIFILFPTLCRLETGYEYRTNLNPFIGVEITDYTGNAQSLTVPSRLTFFKILEIWNGVYQNNHNIKSVYIPEDVEVVPSFAGCANLKQISFSDNCKCTAIYDFARCISLNDVVLPESIEYISDQAFVSCISLENIYIPNTVKYIGYDVFGHTLFKEKHKTDEYYVAGDNILLFYNGDRSTIVIPLGIRSVCKYSLNDFDNSDQKENIVIYYPSSIERIDPIINEKTIIYCPSMEEIDIDSYDIQFIKGTIVAPRGSYLEKFCKENNIDFKVMTDEEKKICEEKTKSVVDRVKYANED